MPRSTEDRIQSLAVSDLANIHSHTESNNCLVLS